jgi:hypothetical protein
MIWRRHSQFRFAAELVLVIQEGLVLSREEQLPFDLIRNSPGIRGLHEWGLG